MTNNVTIPYTQGQLMNDLHALGLTQGQVVMLHSSVKAVGAVMGGPNVILQAILDTVGKDGTLMMYASWQDIPDFVLDLPAEARQAYYDEHPPFDPTIARAVRENSILAEFLRTWPGAQRSLNPEASMVAVGAGLSQPTGLRNRPFILNVSLTHPPPKRVKTRGESAAI